LKSSGVSVVENINLKHTTMKTYLIQRGTIKNQELKIGIDSIIEFDYMGASEYEWGALPNSLKRIRNHINEYTYLDVPLFGKCVSVFCNNEQKAEVMEYLKELANGEMHTKLGSYFDQYIKPSKYGLEWQREYPLKTNFWWDIENNLMFWGKNPEFELKFKSLIVTKPS
jgi:hypothetical protein